MSDTQRLMELEGHPGWRYAAATGATFYSERVVSNGWQRDSFDKRHLRLVEKEDDERAQD